MKTLIIGAMPGPPVIRLSRDIHIANPGADLVDLTFDSIVVTEQPEEHTQWLGVTITTRLLPDGKVIYTNEQS